jgi:2-keto-4-pentenoate hydratase
LRAGEVITTGTLTPLPAVKPGESWHIETTGIGLTGLGITFKG